MSEIFELLHFSELATIIRACPGLVVLDVDNTLMEPLQELGSVQWYDDCTAALCEQGLDYTLASARVYPEWVKLQKTLPVKPVEPEIPEILHAWQQEGIQVMAMTSRGIDLTYRTVEQLASIGIDLHKNALSDRMFIVEPPSPLHSHQGIMYKRGVLLCQPPSNKGTVLKRFLEAIKTVPEQIIFVDDVLSNIQDVQVALADTGISVVGIRYGACDEKVRNFNRSLAQAQLKQLQST